MVKLINRVYKGSHPETTVQVYLVDEVLGRDICGVEKWPKRLKQQQLCSTAAENTQHVLLC